MKTNKITLALIAKNKKGMVVVGYNVPSKLLNPLKQLGIKIIRENNIKEYLDTRGIVPVEPSAYYGDNFVADEEKFDKILYLTKDIVNDVTVSYATSFAVKCINNGLIRISAPIDVCVDVPGEIASVTPISVPSEPLVAVTNKQLEIGYLANSIFLLEKGFSLGREEYYNVFIPLLQTSGNYNLIQCTEYPYSVPKLIPFVAKNPHIDLRVLNNIFHYVCSVMDNRDLCVTIITNLLNNYTVCSNTVMQQQVLDFNKFVHNTWANQDRTKGGEF